MNQKSILAGASIALGCILFILTPVKILGALLFSVGLLNIRQEKLALFTGKIQCLRTERMSAWKLAGVLAGNVVGVAALALLAHWMNTDITIAAQNIVAARLAMPFLQLLFMSMVCGSLMTIATRPQTPLWLSSMCVLGFISAGATHCVADAFYYCFAPSWPALWAWIVTVCGNIIGGLIILPIKKEES